MTEQSASDTAGGQTQDMENLEVQDPQVPASSTPMVPTLKLVPFVQKVGEEIPHFNTIFYDKATKRIVKRTERRVETGGLPGKMITDTAVVLGTNQDPRFTIRVRAALIQDSEDNLDSIMTDLELSKKFSAQLKYTLRKEREESNRMKRKYEDMKEEMRASKNELQLLQVERQVRETTQECLEKVQKEYQELKMEKERLQGKVEELEEQQKIILEASEMHTQEQGKKHQEQITSLIAALEEAREQQVNLQPFKEHVLAQKAKML